MGIFLLPPGAEIPLHDHPGMTVLTRVLFGSLDVFACDWSGETSAVGNQSPALGPSKDCLDSATSKARPAILRFDGRIDAPATSVLTPDRGNLHTFRASAPHGCAVLDVITPPYDAAWGRPCTYYRRSALRRGAVDSGAGNSAPREELFLLEEFSADDFFCGSEPYRGPSVGGASG
jgi:cysteamine dioxygenase